MGEAHVKAPGSLLDFVGWGVKVEGEEISGGLELAFGFRNRNWGVWLFLRLLCLSVFSQFIFVNKRLGCREILRRGWV